MALLQNYLPVMGVRVIDDDRALYNFLPVIGVRAATGPFIDNKVVRGVQPQAAGVWVWNEQPVRGVRVITDARTMYNGQPVIPVSGLMPEMNVTGGIITGFRSGGVDYVEIAFSASGSFTLSQEVPLSRWALGAGGGAGGRVSTTSTIGSPGGAGGLERSAAEVTLPAGTYNVAIGAGAPATNVAGGSVNGSDSVLTMPNLALITALGGGKGASIGVGNTEGGNGGSGGGGRATSGSEGTTSAPGTGLAGQGFAGGLGANSPTDANKATGGSGGAGSAGGNASLGVPGTAGAGVLLDWIASPRTVCAGQPGILATQTSATPDQTWGNGSQAAINAQVGKGGDGFFFLVVRADQVNVKSTVTITGAAAISTFDLGGVNYTRILFNSSGAFTVSNPIGGARHGLVGGGGAGGKTAGPGTRGGGGGGGRALDSGLVTLLAGSYTATIGAGAPSNITTNGQGANGSSSSIAGPSLALTAEGGGGGGGNTAGFNDGQPGGNGGGGAGTGATPTVGGVGVQFNGGAGFMAADTSKAAGGGGGAGGVGQAGVANVGGNGGIGLDWAWAGGLAVAGGGGGVGLTNGSATHGGAPAGVTQDGVNGGGSGGRQTQDTGKGGDGLFVLVVPTSVIRVVFA